FLLAKSNHEKTREVARHCWGTYPCPSKRQRKPRRQAERSQSFRRKLALPPKTLPEQALLMLRQEVQTMLHWSAEPARSYLSQSSKNPSRAAAWSRTRRRRTSCPLRLARSE